MTVNRSIFASTKFRLALLFTAGALVGLGGKVFYGIYYSPFKSTCVAPTSYYTIEDANNATLVRGIYRSYRDSLFSGHTTYIGSLSHFKEGKLAGRPTAIHREVRFDTDVEGKRIHLTVTSQHRKLGDQSSDREVKDYVYPHIDRGEVATSTIYMLDNKVLASGTESVARIACTN
ncbi:MULTISPECIES: hypothetical protein [Enterobacter cloacae complex]|jgi:hypothetical protein|uniref:hypothetical protein n=1 Tax=Enterobacter TaxID=547 RepID=UPI000750325B|nr:hypothetical protein [Enterobacter ludwigii]ELN9420534.1 hypothetical protein [Enterobacter ludwigii]KUQ40536.1 hypothetical protein AWI16_19540 [Enterobacter ludwigii]MBX8877888.1 hypothetical protein [Enterobacter ludwigii]MCR5990050.1 hypothetical protein [Enterobacter ludwigii]MDH1543861.1 hypothetical protein [Enterobacter ludwigii]